MKYILNQASRWKLLAGVILLLVILFSELIFGSHLFRLLFGSLKNIPALLFFSRMLFWACLLAIWIYAKTVEKQKLLLIEEKKYSFLAYFLSIIAVFALIIVGGGLISSTLLKAGFNPESAKMDQMIVLFRGNYFLLFLTCITAGFVEELTFRGYLMPRLIVLTKSPVFAVLFSSVLFGLLHFGYGSVFEIAGPFFIGLVFAFYYYEFRNIKVVIFCHVMWDVMAIFVGIYRHKLGH